jgi:predicted nucleic acid-binding protein
VALIVISDSSPIRALDHLGLLELAPKLYGEVIIPEAVQKELRSATSVCRAIEITDCPGFIIRSPNADPAALGVPLDLDAGETDAIALAIELRADLLLVDERKATAAARQLGLTTIGVFGLLLDAKRQGLVEALLPLVDRLVRDLRFFTSPALRQRLAELAGE